MQHNKENHFVEDAKQFQEKAKLYQGNYYTLDGELITIIPSSKEGFRSCKSLYYKKKQPIPGR
ncbi:Schizosaccharomyces specific microprotein Smp2 [Schizosaccharomyces pombe]|uniref:Putative uncharacterized protein C13G1.16 n=1 Tax=Schizosaccharomyces pombe (strain 972 / ATCC 24843) TaxID=284812 RepID=YBBG_SCHPO|nr:uncharacterized protein SPBC13G1.16 [Schizosaccharomyces pombe]G2TRR7.1 RecName: Full=Putative uncharacterized protein C13G1.16 [Schizosaccharomyces pombe 972h-]CCD31383.1 dubious [Schizosaccharomyces pombe]|eukprot:NP_001343173.1 uncharacterized protein SPBC13G1.16 [Schizosaccharomyces pombe]